jgi:hypothetical protein
VSGLVAPHFCYSLKAMSIRLVATIAGAIAVATTFSGNRTNHKNVTLARGVLTLADLPYRVTVNRAT